MAGKSYLQIDVFTQNDKKDGGSLQISARKVIGFFSVNGNGVYRDDASQLKYLHSKISNDMRVKFDLDHLHDSVVKKDSALYKTWNKLNNMFFWVTLNSSRILGTGEVAFVTFRGNITKIMCSPYESKDDWTICAKYSNGIIYLNSFDTENDITKAESASRFQLKCQTWGFKFEQYLLTDDPKKKPDPNHTLNENEEFCCVFDRNIGSHRIIYGAEMDGIISPEILDLKNSNYDLSEAEFVELKTNRIIENHKQSNTLRRFKMLKWWCQSYLSGIETIVCGFRDDSGVVRTLKSYKVEELPTLACGFWDKDVCVNFCIRFLNFVKKVIVESNSSPSNDVWKFDFVPMRKIYASRVIDDSSIYKADFREIKINHGC